MARSIFILMVFFTAVIVIRAKSLRRDGIFQSFASESDADFRDGDNLPDLERYHYYGPITKLKPGNSYHEYDREAKSFNEREAETANHKKYYGYDELAKEKALLSVNRDMTSFLNELAKKIAPDAELYLGNEEDA